MIISSRPSAYHPTPQNIPYQNNTGDYSVFKSVKKLNCKFGRFFSISGLIQNHLEGRKGTMFSKNCDYLVENEFSSSSRGQRPAAESLNSDLCYREFPICKNNKKIDPSIEICQFG